jgi:hypothetical protein
MAFSKNGYKDLQTIREIHGSDLKGYRPKPSSVPSKLYNLTNCNLNLESPLSSSTTLTVTSSVSSTSSPSLSYLEINGTPNSSSAPSVQSIGDTDLPGYRTQDSVPTSPPSYHPESPVASVAPLDTTWSPPFSARDHPFAHDAEWWQTQVPFTMPMFDVANYVSGIRENVARQWHLDTHVQCPFDFNYVISWLGARDYQLTQPGRDEVYRFDYDSGAWIRRTLFQRAVPPSPQWWIPFFPIAPISDQSTYLALNGVQQSTLWHSEVSVRDPSDSTGVISFVDQSFRLRSNLAWIWDGLHQAWVPDFSWSPPQWSLSVA